MARTQALITTDNPEDQTETRWGRVYLAVYVLYIGLGLAARFLGWMHIDAIWFVQAGRHVLDGSFDIYTFKSSPDIAPPDGLAFSYSPLVAIVVAPFVGTADLFGWGDVWAQRLVAVPFLVIDMLAMQQMRRLARVWRPLMDERFLFLGVLVTLFLTGFWVTTAFRGHHEGMVLLFLLLTLRLTPRNLLLGGVCAGLTLAAKQTALLELIPIGLVLLALSRRQKESIRPSQWVPMGALRDTLIWTSIAVGMFALFMLPALIRNAGAVWYAFVTQEARRVVLGPGLPVWLDKAMQSGLAAPDYARWHDWLLGYSNAALVGAVLLVSAWAVWWARSRENTIGLVDSRLLALVAFGGVAQVVFAKWVSGHYYQLPLALVLVWDVVRTAPRSGVERIGLASFPWIGLGAAIAFRSITPFDTPDAPWFKDALLLALFAALAVMSIRASASQDG